MFKEIKKCTLCGSRELASILNLKDQPPANNLRLSLNSKLENIPLILCFCNSCSVPQLKHIVDEKELFSNYFWVTGTSSTAINHSNFFFNEAINKLDLKKSHVLEIASNDGTFLKPFKNSGHDVLGVDPAKNICELANINGINTLNEFFNDDLIDSYPNLENNFDLVIARNVLPHVKYLHSIIRGIKRTLKKKGFCVVEFHNARTILKELHYDSIYHEHLYYFSLTTLTNLFESYELFPFDLSHSPISGGSWIVYFGNENNIKSRVLLEELEKEKIEKINTLQTWQDFSQKTKNHSLSLNKKLSEFNGKIIGYGASARSSTLLNFCNIGNDKIDFIVDKNELKSNHYTPGSNIIIKSPKFLEQNIDGVDLILILAWNFRDEIVKELKEIGYHGSVLVPFPEKVNIYEI